MSAKENLINYIKDKSILIMGFGREGKSTYKLIREFLPDKKIAISDKNNVKVENDENVDLICGEKYLECAKDYELVFKSPGIPFIDIPLSENTVITCQTDMFMKFAQCKKIGITGTKGKTTTSTLIYRMLTESGIDACLIGNIGVPVFEDLDKDENTVAVIEMSSHQLEFTRTSPDVAVLTNIYEEHLDHYKDGFKGYVDAKLNIVRNQKNGDFFIYNGTQGLDGYFDVDSVPCDKIKVYENSDDEFVASLEHLNKNLIGKHHIQDIGFAVAASRKMGATDCGIYNAVKNFEGIPNRMECFGFFGGVDYYNDSIATIPRACLCAVEAIGNVGTLIIGGLDRGLDYSEFEKDLENLNVDYIIGLPETGHNIISHIQGKSKAVLYKAKDMADCVDFAVKYTKPDKSCLMSPAAASYNYYKDFEEKGNHYKTLVKAHFGG